MPESVTKQRKLVAPRITEVSGVDRPAHLRDGFFIRKSVGTEGADALLAALGRGASMPKTVEAATAATLLKSLTPEQRTTLGGEDGAAALAKALTPEQTTEFTKAAGGDLAPILDQLATVWQAVRDLSEKEDPDVPSTEGAIDPTTGQPAVQPAAPDAAAVLASPALAKALGDDAVAMLKSLAERASAAEAREAETMQKALDATAVTEFEKAYGGIGVDAGVVAPALRQFAESSPEAADAIRTGLAKAVETTRANRAIIVKELGTVAAPMPDSPSGRVESMAKSLVESGEQKTIEQARAAVYSAHPDLYDAARNGAGEE
jgi:hypothetical protein